MKLTWHIVLKDLRRLWPWLALLVGATLTRYLNFHSPGYAPEHNELVAIWDRAEMIDNILLGLSLVTTAIVTALLVHEDPLTGQNAFWFSRPISGARLLAAKFLTLTLAVVVVPLAIMIGWWLFQHYSATDIASQVPLYMRPAGIAFGALCFALLTRNLGSFTLTAILTLLAVVFTHNVVVAQWIGMPPNRGNSGDVLELIVAFIALVACILNQYLTRRTRRTLVIFGAGSVLCLTIFATWTSDIFKFTSRFDYRPWLTGSFPATTASITPPVPVVHSRKSRAVSGVRNETNEAPALAFSLKLGPIPASHAVQISRASFPKDTPLSLQYDNHVTISRPSYPVDYTTDDTLLLSPTGHGVPEIPAPTELKLRLILRRPETTSQLPLKIGASGARGARRLQIISIENISNNTSSATRVSSRDVRTTRGLTLILDETLPPNLPSVDGRHAEHDNDIFYFATGGQPPSFREGNSRHAFFLVSRRDGTAISADKIMVPTKLMVDGVRRRLVRAEFPIQLRETDLADYELIKVVAPIVGYFDRTVTIPASRK